MNRGTYHSGSIDLASYGYSFKSRPSGGYRRRSQNSRSFHSSAMGRSAHRKQDLPGMLLSLLAVVAGVMILAAILTNVLAKNVDAGNQAAAIEHVRSIQVEEGQTLWDIADAQMGAGFSDKKEFIAEVEEINHIDGNMIHAGSYLLVPYYA